MRASPIGQWAEFGASLRALRESKGFGLRPFARAIKIAPSYQVFIEKGQVPPPSNEFLLCMAEVLELPAHQLFALAGRLPPDVQVAFWQHPAVPPILSTIPGMSLDDAQTFCKMVLATLPQLAYSHAAKDSRVFKPHNRRT